MAGEVKKQQFSEGTAVGTPTDISGTSDTSGTITTYVPVIKSSIKETSTAYAVLDDDGFNKILVTTGGTNISITLPTEADNTGREILIKNVDSGTGNVVVRDGGGSIITETETEGAYFKFFCDGTTWQIIATNDYVHEFASTGTTVSNTTNTNIDSIALEVGTWHITVSFHFNTAATAGAGLDYGKGYFGTSATPTTAGTRGLDVTEGAINSARGHAAIDRVLVVATAATYYTHGFVSSGVSSLHEMISAVTATRISE